MHWMCVCVCQSEKVCVLVWMHESVNGKRQRRWLCQNISLLFEKNFGLVKKKNYFPLRFYIIATYVRCICQVGRCVKHLSSNNDYSDFPTKCFYTSIYVRKKKDDNQYILLRFAFSRPPSMQYLRLWNGMTSFCSDAKIVMIILSI